MNNANSGNMRELFLNQSLAMEFWPALEQPTLQKSKLDWDFAPGIAPAGKTPVGTYGGWNLAVYQSSPHQDAAWKFIQFLTREDVNGAVVDLIPANVKAAKAFLAANRKAPDRIMELLDHAAPRPLSPRYLEAVGHRGDAGPGRLWRQGCRRGRQGRLQPRSTRCAKRLAFRSMHVLTLNSRPHSGRREAAIRNRGASLDVRWCAPVPGSAAPPRNEEIGRARSSC